jgi:hypothetical protein
MIFRSSNSYGNLIHTISSPVPPERSYRPPSLRLATYACLCVSLQSILTIWHKPIDLTSLSCIVCHVCPNIMLSNSSLRLTASFSVPNSLPTSHKSLFLTDYSFPLQNPAPEVVAHRATSFLSYLSHPVPIMLLRQPHYLNKS